MRHIDMNRSRLTRRRFLAGTGAGFLGLLAACSGPDDNSPPTPTPSPALNTTPGMDAVDSDEPGNATADQHEAGNNTSTAVATRPPSEITVDFVPVVSRRLQIRDIPFDQIEALWHGDITDWNELGEPGSHPVKRLSIEGLAGPMSLEHVDVNIEKLDDLERFLHFETGAIGFLPRQRVDYRFRRLQVDGHDYLIHPDATNPLRTVIEVDPGRPEHFDIIRDANGGPSPVSMTWVGDIIFGRFVHKALERVGDFSASFWDVQSELTWADFTIGNLECSLSDNIPQPEDSHTFSFTTSAAAVEGLKLAEIDVLSRANNHSFNFGIPGMDDTTAVLDEAGIRHFGMGHNLDEARQAIVIEKHGVTYALLGYNGITDDWDGAGPDWAGTMPMEPEYVIEDIQRELAAGHVVIPYFHWGIEYVADPSEEQRYFAQLAIDHGASLVMGSHPHWVQAVETYQGKPIIYSLGNFIFDQAWSIETQQGMIAHVWMQGTDVLSIDLVPVFIEQEHRPRVMGPAEAAPVLNRVWDASERIIVSG